VQYRKPHPWDPKYAIPKYVMAEPGLRGTFTAKYRRRRSIDAPSIPAPWRTGYAYPDYVGKEPIGRGVYRTKYMPRRTVDTLVPRYISGLDGVDHETDVIAEFGRKVANHVMGTVFRLAPSMRKPAMKALFDQLDPKLWSRVKEKATQVQKEQGIGADEALKRAIAASTSQGLLEEFISAGRGKPLSANSMSGLAAYGEAAEVIVLEGVMSELGAWYNPVDWVKGAGSQLSRAGGAITRTVGGSAGSVYGWAKTAAGKIGDLACGVANSGLGKTAAGAGAVAAGAPPQVGAKGVETVQKLCGSQAAQQAAAQELARQKKFPIVPVAIGGAALLTVILIASRRR